MRMRRSQTMAACAMMAALSMVIMLIGSALGLGMYASPMMAGLCLLPLGRNRKYQWLVWMTVSLLSLMLVPDAEQNLMYIVLFGLYPILYPGFEKLNRRIKWLCKLLYFNMVVVAAEALVMLVLVPESPGIWLSVVLLLMGNAVFICYDFLLPRAEKIAQHYLRRFRNRG